MQRFGLVTKDCPNNLPVLWINNAKIFSAFIVIFLHVSVGVVGGLPNVNSLYWWVGNSFDSFARWCIPVFVMISGALLLDTAKAEPMIVFYKKRISRIFFPLVFWTIFFLLWKYFQSYFGIGEHVTTGSLISSTLEGVPYYHLWYLYMILGLYLLTPFFRRIARQSSDNELLFLCVSLFAFSMVGILYTKGHLPSIFASVFYLPYFFIGYLISKTKFNPPSWVLYIIFILSIILTSIGYHSQVNEINNQYFYNYLSITVVPMSISIMFLFKRFPFPIIKSSISTKLALLSFGIYLIHPVFIGILSFFGIRAELYNPLISIPLIAVSVFTLALIVSMVISKIPLFNRIIGLS